MTVALVGSLLLIAAIVIAILGSRPSKRHQQKMRAEAERRYRLDVERDQPDP